jgi:hypothetical protein
MSDKGKDSMRMLSRISTHLSAIAQMLQVIALNYSLQSKTESREPGKAICEPTRNIKMNILCQN